MKSLIIADFASFASLFFAVFALKKEFNRKARKVFRKVREELISISLSSYFLNYFMSNSR